MNRWIEEIERKEIFEKEQKGIPNEKCCTKVARIMMPSVMTNFCPMQFRSPNEKGTKERD